MPNYNTWRDLLGRIDQGTTWTSSSATPARAVPIPGVGHSEACGRGGDWPRRVCPGCRKDARGDRNRFEAVIQHGPGYSPTRDAQLRVAENAEAATGTMREFASTVLNIGFDAASFQSQVLAAYTAQAEARLYEPVGIIHQAQYFGPGLDINGYPSPRWNR